MKALFDLKYAVRMLLKKPGFSLVTIGVMATGFALCVYMLSFIQTTMLRPLPFEGGEDMAVIEAMVDGVGWNGGSIEQYEYHSIREEAQSFSEMGWYYTGTANISDGESSVRYSGAFAEPEIFPYTGIQPVLGRVFGDDDTQIGAIPVAVISHLMWQDYFAGDDQIVGRKIKVNGTQTVVVGVMPEGFRFPTAQDIWLPNPEDVNAVKKGLGAGGVVFTKLKPGVSLDEAQLELSAIMKRLEERYPDSNNGVGAYIATFQENMMGTGVRPIVTTMILAVFFVMALACFNVGNLLLARANERSKETAIRLALGAPAGRLVLQMMWESIIICTCGAILGVLLAALASEMTQSALPNMMPVAIPYWWDMGIKTDVLLYTLILTITTALATGLLPALLMVRSDFNAVLRDGTRGAVGKKSGHINRGLVVAEVALSCTLMIVSSVLYLLLDQANHADYGANTDNVLTARLGLPGDIYSGDGERYRFFRDVINEVATIPGVESVAAMSSLPSAYTGSENVLPEGMEIIDGNYPRVSFAIGSVESLETLQMRLLQGRWFDSRDLADTLAVTVVTDTAADRLWPGEDPIGKRLKNLSSETDEWLTVVGVVKHVIHGQPFEPTRRNPTNYRPMSQSPERFMSIALRTHTDPDLYRDQLLKALARVDNEIPAYSITSLNDRIKRSTGGMDFLNKNFVVFAFAALLLAATGIFGVLSNTTQRRTQEIGVRRAIGADDQNIMHMLIKQGGILCAVGLMIGCPMAYMMSNVFVGMLGSENSSYQFMFLVVPLVITGVVGLATWMPARRAIRMEPSAALRYE
jgi:predicted permease